MKRGARNDAHSTLTSSPLIHHLQRLAGAGRDSGSDAGGAEELDGRVGEGVGGEGALGDGVGRAAEIDVIDDDVASLVGVGEEDGLLARVHERRALHQQLRALARVDPGVQQRLVVVVHDVHRAEPHRRRPAVDVLPVVVRVRHPQVSRVLVPVAVRVSDQRRLPLFRAWVSR